MKAKGRKTDRFKYPENAKGAFPDPKPDPENAKAVLQNVTLNQNRIDPEAYKAVQQLAVAISHTAQALGRIGSYESLIKISNGSNISISDSNFTGAQ